MYDDKAWMCMGGDEAADLLKRINPVDGKCSVSPETTTVCWRSLPFYEKFVLLRVIDPGWPVRNLSIYYLSDGTKLYRLNGTSPPIHEVNERAPVRLTEDNIRDYLRFFFWFVRAKEEPFVLVEQMPPLPGDVDARTRAELEETIHPAICERMDGRDCFTCSAAVCHSGKLFSAMVEVYRDGMVAMIDDDLIATDFPVGEIEPIA